MLPLFGKDMECEEIARLLQQEEEWKMMKNQRDTHPRKMSTSKLVKLRLPMTILFLHIN
jgi:hypothetical protein